ncbi:MAG TPA: hypothetical protein VFX30_10475 [bacterium]|nr:hypothetical protein [bacterium]
MKCAYCEEKAGFFKRVCKDCDRLVETVKEIHGRAEREGGFGYRDLLDTLIATGIDHAKIEKFLDADVDGRGSVNDQITARMTNQIMESMGQPSQMTGKDVKKVRKDIAEGKAPSQTDAEVVDYSQLKGKT